jgi:hypothetical protein
MLDALSTTCEARGCDRPLTGVPAIEYETGAGTRRAYECECGAVTVTVLRR